MAHPPPPLFELSDPSKPSGPGPVYQGVAKQLRAMIEAGTIDRARDAGLIAAARSLARSIDHASGHGGSKPQGGMQLAALHSQLAAHLATLAPEVDEDDPLTRLAADMAALERANRGAS